MDSSRTELLHTLARRIEEIESERRPGPSAIRLRIPALEKLLPRRRLQAGSLVELLSAEAGAGAWTLALLLAKAVCGTRRVLVILDGEGCFYPPAACQLGVDLDRTVVIHPRRRGDVCAAIQQSLRCAAVGAVLGSCRGIEAVEFRRFQLAAEKGNSVGILLRPASEAGAPSFAALRLGVAPVAATGNSRRIEVEVLRCRTGKCGQSLLLDIDDETGHVHLPAEVAAATPRTRTARASG
jgi:protein ImuA